MDHHSLSTLENDQALDFTATPKRSLSRDQIVESPVLDLSCKKQNDNNKNNNQSSCSLSPVSIEAISNPPSIETPPNVESTRLHHNDNYPERERKSPVESRNFMVTPPSEVDSPRKLRYEKIYENTNDVTSIGTNESSNQHRYLIMKTSLPPLPIVRADILSNSTIPQNGHELAATNHQIPVSTSINKTTNDVGCSLGITEQAKKVPRPFKAYPKDPLSMSVVGSPEFMYDQTSTEAYTEFRKRMLESVRRTNEGTNIKMRRVTKSPGLPTSTMMMDDKDAAYWERRRKNNEAAKRSRDARRAKEDEIAIRAAFLEQENMKLKYELVALRNETAKLRCMVYTN